MQPFPATGAKYQVTREGGNHPVWSPDVKELFVMNNVNNGRLFSMNVQTQPVFTFSNPVPLPIQGFIQGIGGARHYDITPDGKQFIMMFPPGQGSTDSRTTLQIQVVLNWLEELKQRVPVK